MRGGGEGGRPPGGICCLSACGRDLPRRPPEGAGPLGVDAWPLADNVGGGTHALSFSVPHPSELSGSAQPPSPESCRRGCAVWGSQGHKGLRPRRLEPLLGRAGQRAAWCPCVVGSRPLGGLGAEPPLSCGPFSTCSQILQEDQWEPSKSRLSQEQKCLISFPLDRGPGERISRGGTEKERGVLLKAEATNGGEGPGGRHQGQRVPSRPSPALRGLADGACHGEGTGDVLSARPRSPGSWRREALGLARPRA